MNHFHLIITIVILTNIYIYILYTQQARARPERLEALIFPIKNGQLLGEKGHSPVVGSSIVCGARSRDNPQTPRPKIKVVIYPILSHLWLVLSYNIINLYAQFLIYT